MWGTVAHFPHGTINSFFEELGANELFKKHIIIVINSYCRR